MEKEWNRGEVGREQRKSKRKENKGEIGTEQGRDRKGIGER